MTRHRRGPRGDIHAADLLDSGEVILKDKGLRGLSLRAIAEGADVSPTVIYTYFSNLGDLRNCLGDRFLGRINLALLQSGEPREALSTFMGHVIDLFRAESGFVELLAAQPIFGPQALALNEALLDFFIGRVGHCPQNAASITYFLTEWLHGHILLQASETEPEPQFVAEISAEDFPLTREMFGSAPGQWALQTMVTAVTAVPNS